MKQLQGTWRVTSLETDGNTVPLGLVGESKIIIDGEYLAVNTNSNNELPTALARTGVAPNDDAFRGMARNPCLISLRKWLEPPSCSSH